MSNQNTRNETTRNTQSRKPVSAERNDRGGFARPPRQQQALTAGQPRQRQDRQHNNPLNTPALQAHLRSLKRVEYKSKTREELTPSHTFPAHLNSIQSIGQPGRDHINTARWTEDDLSGVFSLANGIPFDFSLFDVKIATLFHVYAFLWCGARQPTTLFARDSSSLDSLVRGKPEVLANRFAIFAYAVYQKISQTPDLCAIAQSTNVPFDYYITSRERNDKAGGRRRIYESGVISAAFEEARIAVKKDTYPNLLPFFDLDYQIELEEISDPEARHIRCMELLQQTCAPLREKIKKVEANMKAPAPVKGPKKARGETSNVVIQDEASHIDTTKPQAEQADGERVPGAPIPDRGADFDGVVEPTDFTAMIPVNVSRDADGKQVVTAVEIGDAVEVSTNANTDPGEQAPVPQEDEGQVVVLDAFKAPSLLSQAAL